MKNNDFLSNLFQTIGFLAAIIIAISQYAFSNQFKALFIDNQSLYNLSTTCALGISLASIIGFYSNRFLLDNKKYLFWWEEENYYKNLGKSENNKNTIIEPFSWKVSDLGIVFLLIAFLSFYFLLASNNLIAVSVAYIVFICSTINSITIYSLKIYNWQDWKNNEERNRTRIIEKINEYFAGNFKISTEFKNEADIMYPTRTLILEKDSKKYQVIADANNPDKYFKIIEITQ